MWRYEQLPTESNVFRARGLAYASAFKFIDSRLAGGRDAFLAAIAPDARPFYDQIFVVAGDYSISPLVHLFVTLARLEKAPIEAFIAERAQWSGSSDSKGVWKPALHGATPKDVAPRLHFAFNRYFPGCEAHPIEARESEFHGELRNIPSCMNGLYAASTTGFYRGALEGAGGTEIAVQWERPKPEGRHDGIPVERLRFTASWKFISST